MFERLFSRNIGLGAQPQTAASTVHTWSNNKSIPKNGSTPILELESGLSKSYYKILSKIKYLRYLRFAQFVELPKIRFVLRVYDRWIGYVVPFFSQISVQRNEIFWLKDKKTTLTKLSEKMLKTSKIVKNVRNRQQIQKKVKKISRVRGLFFTNMNIFHNLNSCNRRWPWHSKKWMSPTRKMSRFICNWLGDTFRSHENVLFRNCKSFSNDSI